MHQNSNSVLLTKGITKNFQVAGRAVPVLRGINLEVKPGSIVALVGSSGSGKSTLMSVLGCLDSPTAGSYRIAGEEVANMGADALAEVRAQRIGFVFQKFNLVSSLSAKENVVLPQLYNNILRPQAETRALELLQLVGLEAWQAHLPYQMSGGQQQRVAIARALANRPQIILADEPTGSLDSKTGSMIVALFQQLRQSLGLTVMLVTHDNQVAQTADKIFTMVDGQLV
jgi:putative ABC transport system ATP-binding protein